MVYLVCLLIGIAAAFLGGMVGMGGGIILIPALLFLNQFSDAFVWATPQVIVGISLITMVFTALSSTRAYAKQQLIDYQTGFLLLIGSIPGAVLGSWLNKFFNPEQFSLYFGSLIVVVSLLSFLKKEQRKPNEQMTHEHGLRTFQIGDQTYHYVVSVLPALVISFIVGLLSGLFGIGGGSITVPALMLVFGMPIQVAVATSMFIIVFISLISTGTHIYLGNIVWQYAYLFMIGAWIGGTTGARVNRLLKGKTLEWILRTVLIVVGVRLILDGLI